MPAVQETGVCAMCVGFILDVIVLRSSKDVIVSSLDYEGDPGAQNQDLRVSRYGRRRGQQTHPQDKGTDRICQLSKVH